MGIAGQYRIGLAHRRELRLAREHAGYSRLFEVSGVGGGGIGNSLMVPLGRMTRSNLSPGPYAF